VGAEAFGAASHFAHRGTRVFGAALAEAATSDTSIWTHEEDIASDPMRVAHAFIAGRGRHFDDLDRYACAPDSASASRGSKCGRPLNQMSITGGKPGRCNVD